MALFLLTALHLNILRFVPLSRFSEIDIVPLTKDFSTVWSLLNMP